MPRFPVSFGKRKPAAQNPNDFQNGPTGESSFRVMERAEVPGGNGGSGGGVKAAVDAIQRSALLPQPPRASHPSSYENDDIFVDLKYSRGSGASNTTKTTISTDNSSRHSNVSTAPSSADMASHDDARGGRKAEAPLPPVPKNNSGWSLKNAGRTFSFGGQKKPLASTPPEQTESDYPPMPMLMPRARSKTASTSTTSNTATPPKLNDQDFNLDLGGDFGGMFSGSNFDKRGSVMTLRQQQHAQVPDDRQALAPRSLTGNRLNQPAPLRIDRSSRVEESPYSWNSQHSGDQLISASPIQSSPTNENALPLPPANAPPPVPKHGAPVPGRMSRTNTDGLKRSSAVFGRRRSTTEPADADDEDAQLLKQSMAANRALGNPTAPPSASGRYRRNERFDKDDDNMFDSGMVQSTQAARRFINQPASPPRNKVMTPAQFEKYRQDKERQDTQPGAAKNSDEDDEDEVNYEDDEDDIEKSKQMARQRRKQEATMAVYRQQMMKVTGESGASASMSTPNLMLSAPGGNGVSDGSDEDEEVPLAILAAHGFPHKSRPPNRLSSMASNPNMRASVVGPSIQRPESAAEGSQVGGSGGRLPAFARRLPQDPYGIVNNSVRESIHMGGGSPAPGGPPGGLVGVIATEERNRAMRRGSPMIDGSGGYEQQTMYSQQQQQQQQQQAMFNPVDQSNVQMNAQMQQFMQMQMQFMQMMAGQQGGGMPGGMPPGMMPPGMPGGGLQIPQGMDQRRSYIDPSTGLDSVRGDAGLRTMSMVNPSSASFYGQPAMGMGMGAPSIHIQGQYAASIAPSERSNIGLPGRYRPVSHMPPPQPEPMHQRSVSNMSGSLGVPGQGAGPAIRTVTPPKPSGQQQKPPSDDEEDDEKGWQAMKAKRETRKSLWRGKKSFGAELSALIR